MEITELTALELSVRLRRGELSSVEATTACLSRMARVEPAIQAFLHLDEAGALAAAQASDRRRAGGSPRGPLDGVPLALKDLLCTEGLQTTAGSRILQGFVPPYDATVVSRLRAAGMPLLGKLNQDEFAMGSSTENSAFHPTHNPWDLARTPGGSSGGSAAAVAARECFASLGTDTGGSIRQPASFTNTVGLKPTWGRVSRYGVIAYASSLDQVGPITRTVADAAALYSVIAGHDPRDATCSQQQVDDPSVTLEAGVEGLRLGLPREYFVEGTDRRVREAIDAAARRYEQLGATVLEVSLPHTAYALAAYYLIATAEASSNLARYDGVRFGHRAAGTKGLEQMYEQTRAEGFGAEVKRRIMLGTWALSAGYYEAHYLKAQKVRTLIRQDFTAAFEQVDALIAPASPVPAFRLGEKLDDPLAMYLMDVLTVPANLAGLPALSVPCGFTPEGLPIGLQLIGRPFDEAGLLRIAFALERELELYRRVPPPPP
jgi:aspartyl-tRNA(Asn)/glutamyl-tRNA(Gln) amidotransferase subunit A